MPLPPSVFEQLLQQRQATASAAAIRVDQPDLLTFYQQQQQEQQLLASLAAHGISADSSLVNAFQQQQHQQQQQQHQQQQQQSLQQQQHHQGLSWGASSNLSVRTLHDPSLQLPPGMAMETNPFLRDTLFRGHQGNSPMPQEQLGVSNMSRVDDVNGGGAESEHFLLLPCRARGMPTDHNTSTAYFQITADTPHGHHLQCSFPACRESGVKFRFCRRCRKPVTKQNFRARHLHPEEDLGKTQQKFLKRKVPEKHKSTKRQKQEDPQKSDQLASSRISKAESTALSTQCETAFMRTVAMAHTPVANLMPTAVVDEEDDGELSSRSPSLPRETPTEFKDPRDNDLALMSFCQPVLGDVSALPGAKNAILSRQNKPSSNQSRRELWANLLHQRPVEYNSLDNWLSDIYSVSDPEKNMEEGEFPSAVLSTISSPRFGLAQQATWNTMLAERPKNSHGLALTTWISKLLTVSCKLTFENSISSGIGISKKKTKPVENNILKASDSETSMI